MTLRHDGWQISLIQLLAIPGLLISFYLWLYHEDLLIAACGSVAWWDDCSRVSGPGAPYAQLGPIPVAALGFAGYAAIFLVTWLRDWSGWIADYLAELIVGLTGLAFLFTAYLTALEVIVIHALCRYCIYSALIITIMFALALSYMRAPVPALQVEAASPAD